MERVIIVSNRLPLSIQPEENDEIQVKPSVGGLATGMKSFYKDYDSVWIGWPGLNREEVGPKLEENIRHELDKEKCFPVFLEEELIELYYGGFSNKTIWPLFHYFTQYTEYEKDTWEAYVKVNEIFADNVLQNIKGGETIWVHDYHLLLLPKMIKDKRPDVTIGFFLHIPFPSYEVFRILPWRNQLINGMLGADLIGFHTFDYARHFMSSIRRLLGYDINFNQIDLKTRIAKAEAFPMGIDYDKFHNAAVELTQKSVKDKSKLHKEIEKYFLMSPEQKLILSIDRLDYTKGIPHRLLAFEKFLETYPEYREKITLVMLCVPSRTGVEQYQIMKNEVDQLVGRINGCFGSINWTPIWYFYRSMPFENLIELYNSCDIALITPVRDGMNLVAKEYIASKTDQKGVLILSEMAGASREMSEALIINPNNMEEVAEAIKDAINMPEEEQIERNTILQERLKRYNVVRWAHDFIDSLINVSEFQKKLTAKKITAATIKKIRKDYQKAKKRIFFLDYNGTLINYKKNPQKAKPDQELLNLLDQLALDKNNNIVLISGWDRDTFNAWFKNKDYHMITEHGSWIKEPGKDWKIIQEMNNDWKAVMRPILEHYVDSTPGSFIEEKYFSLIFHYRKTDPELGTMRSIQLKDELSSMIANQNFEILEGNKLIELKNSGVNKGTAALKLFEREDFDFVLAIGDEWSDEYMFDQLPENAYSVKVGIGHTQALYNIDSPDDVRTLLSQIVKDES